LISDALDAVARDFFTHAPVWAVTQRAR
jgi:hypothetical protein